MSDALSHRAPRACPGSPVAFLVVLTVLATLVLAGCGSSDSPSAAVTATPIKTAIIKLLPRDASVEPPWNGRFVQVNVRVSDPAKMDPADWHVFVNGREPELAKTPSVLRYAPNEAVVAFLFEAPYDEQGTYAFRVAYAPQGEPRVQKSWEYVW